MADWARVLGRVPSGLFVVTAGADTAAAAMLASWVQQCSFDPPMLTVAVRPDRDIVALLKPDSLFALHPIAEGQADLVARFGRGYAPGQNPFDGLDVRTDAGVPVLATSMGHLLCRVTARCNAGDHDLIFARVEGGELRDETAKPMVHVRKNGLKY